MVRRTDRPTVTIAVDLGRIATKTNKQKYSYSTIKVQIIEAPGFAQA